MAFNGIDRLNPVNTGGSFKSKDQRLAEEQLAQARVFDEDQRTEEERKRREERRELISKGAKIIVGVAVTAACNRLGITPDITNPTKEPTPIPTDRPTTEPTLKPEITATPDLGYEGGPVELEELLKNQEIRENYEYLKGWFKYWSGAENRPFNPDSKRMHYSFKPDANNINTGVFVIESEDYPGKMILPPTYSWGPLTPPPTPLQGGEYSIGFGNGPLFISYEITDEVSKATGIPAGAVVVYRDSQWGAEIVGQDGKPVVVGKINKETGMWEVVEVVQVALDSEKYTQDVQQIPENLRDTFTMAESTSYTDRLGRSDLAVAYSKNLNMVVAVDPKNNLPMGVFNEGQTNIPGVDVKGWINVFGTDKVISITSNPDTTKYIFLDEKGKEQPVEVAARDLELVLRGMVGISILERNQELITITPSGLGDIENYAPGSALVDQIKALPNQTVYFSEEVTVEGIDGWSLVVVKGNGGERTVEKNGNVILGVFNPDTVSDPDVKVVLTPMDCFLSFFGKPYNYGTDSRRFQSSFVSISSEFVIMPRGSGKYRIAIVPIE